MALLLTYVLLALGVSFLCSLMEAVLLSITPAYIAALEVDGHPMAGRLRGYKENVDRPLAAILSLNTVAHTVGAAGAGAQAQVVFGEAWFAVASAVLTLLILVVSEIIPKTLGAVAWRTLGPAVGRLLHGVIIITWPLVKLSEFVTEAIARGRAHGRMSRQEFEALADIGHEEGLIDETESKTLKHLLRFGSLRVADAMTPRTVMMTLAQDETVGGVLAEHADLPFSRLPVQGRGADEILGYVLKDELLLRAAEGALDTPVRALMRPIRMYAIDMQLWDVFEDMLKAREHIALAVDQYGGTAGVITLEDLVETLLGMEIVDEVDDVRDMQVLAREQWRRRARRLGLIEEDRPSAAPSAGDGPVEGEGEGEGADEPPAPPAPRTSEPGPPGG